MDRWKAGIRMDGGEAENVIPILGVIGDFWGEGATAASIMRQLKAIGDKPVTVLINSPGGNFFEGQAIYNLLRQHKGEVTVNILGVAGSAASVVAMAGDRIQMPKTAWLFIHNTTAGIDGTKDDHWSLGDDMEKFDQASADLYAARSGHPVLDIVAMMDPGSFLSGVECVEKGFADSLIDEPAVEQGAASRVEVRQRLDILLSRAGMKRGERRAFVSQLFASKPGAVGNGTPSAADDGKPGASVAASELSEALSGLSKNLDGLQQTAKALVE